MKKLLILLAVLLSFSAADIAYAGTPGPGQKAHKAQGSPGGCQGCKHSVTFKNGTPAELTVQRTSVCTAYDPQGYVRTSQANQLCINYNPSTHDYEGMLDEEVRTNVIKHSELVGSTDWTVQNESVSTNNTTAPDGATTASLITNTSTVLPYVSQPVGSSSTGNYAFSEFLKAGTGLSVAMQISDNTANACGTLFTFSNQTFTNGTPTGGCTVVSTAFETVSNPVIGTWYRLKVVVNFTVVSAPLNFTIGLWDNIATGTGTNGATVYEWGAMCENGKDSVGSYIPTNTTTVQRTAQKVFVTPIPWFNQQRGAFVMRLVPKYLSPTVQMRPVFFGDGGVQNGVYVTNSAAGATTMVGAILNNNSAFSSGAAMGSLAVNTAVKIGASYKSKTNVTAMNGTQDTAGTFGTAILPPNINRLDVGDRQDQARPCNCAVSYINYYDKDIKLDKLIKLEQ